MAKKRKNDTRIDPFATAVESSSLDALLENAQAGDQITMPAPSDPSRNITLYCKLINSNDIADSTSVYDKNRRVQALLNENSVSDIINSIKSDGRNQHPALCWQQHGKEIVLAGSRRRKACIIAGSDYLILSSPDFNDDDAKILAVSSDQYIAPSLWELGQAYSQTKQELIGQGRKGSYRELAEIEGVSHTAIADAIKAFENLPQDVLSLYPTANHVGREVAKKLIEARQKDPDGFAKKVNNTANQLADFSQETDDKTALAITKALTSLSTHKSTNRETLDIDNKYITAQKYEKSGDLVIKIDNKVITQKRLEQLTKLLANFN
jgi:ParB family chromosome partitioning protein